MQDILRQDGEPVPSASVLAMLDTGASGTLVQTSVLDGMGFEPFSTAFLSTPSTTVPLERAVYRVRLVLARDVAFETNVVEGPLGKQHVQCLIGRDILDVCRFVYDGPKRRFTLNVAPEAD